MNLHLQISGMSCAHCVRAVEQALTETDGVAVQSVTVGSATIEAADSAAADLATAAVEEAGYTVTAVQEA